jgi:hypothetical protein
MVTSETWKNLRRGKERNKNENRMKGKFKCERKLKDDLKRGDSKRNLKTSNENLCKAGRKILLKKGRNK